MSRNVGGVDRAVRIVAGVILLGMGFAHIVTGGLAIAAYVVGAVALVTGVLRFCPAWSLIGVSTCTANPVPQK